MRIYTAGAISSDNVVGFIENISTGIEIASRLINQGYNVFCSHLDYQYGFFRKLTVEEYQRNSMAWLEVSDVVLVLPNSENSKGTQAEIKRATELGIPVIYKIKDLDLLEN